MSIEIDGVKIDDTYKEPNFDLSQLVSAELYSPRMDESLFFFKDLLGMTETAREGDSVYLRGYEDMFDHSIKLTYREQPGDGVTVWRTSSPQALARRIEALKAKGVEGEWVEGDNGQGPTWVFWDTQGHRHGLLWDIEYYEAPEDQKSDLLSRPQKRPMTGVPIRRIDHVNHLVGNVTKNKDFLMDALGFRLRENIVLNNGIEAAAWMSVSPLVHEIANLGDQSGQSADGEGRLHHVAFWYGYPQHLNDLSDLCMDYGIEIEAGPGKHGVSQANFLYVFEPGGNRIELFGDAGYLIFDPSWRPLTWTEDQIEKAIIWYGSPLPAEYFMYGTPNNAPTGYRTAQEVQALVERA